MKPKIAIVRGKFLNAYEMQFFEPLISDFDITAFGSKTSYHDSFKFPVVKLWSPVDLVDFPYKLPLLNRILVDAHFLYGLEQALRGFDLVHSAETYFHYTRQSLLARKHGYVRRVIATVLENIPFNNEGIWGRKTFKARARQELDHMIALTELTKKALLKEGADPAKISVISHFVDSKRFAPDQLTLRRRMSKDRCDFTIMFSGRLTAVKGVMDFVEMARLLLNDQLLQGYRLRFVMVGGGELFNQLRLTEKSLGISDFFEHAEVPYEDMPLWYRRADICVLPSKPSATYQEQYCTALMEAQAAGLAIVTTRTGGIPENIGNAGVIVEPGNPMELALSVRMFLLSRDKRLRYSNLALRRARNVHDVSKGSEKISKLWQRMLED